MVPTVFDRVPRGQAIPVDCEERDNGLHLSAFHSQNIGGFVFGCRLEKPTRYVAVETDLRTDPVLLHDCGRASPRGVLLRGFLVLADYFRKFIDVVDDPDSKINPDYDFSLALLEGRIKKIRGMLKNLFDSQ